jgi:guanyl-specific ribonuclease Sa
MRRRKCGASPAPQYDACLASQRSIDERRAPIRDRLRQLGIPVEGEGPGSPGANTGEPPIPQNVQDTLSQIDAGKWPGSANAPGTKGGAVFNNREGLLPATDAAGGPITYQEWDVNPKVPGGARDAERIVTGSDGSAWYTDGHYGSFRRIR